MNICNTLALSLVVGILSLLGGGGALSSAAYTNTNNDEQLIFQQQQKPSPLRVFILVGQSNMVRIRVGPVGFASLVQYPEFVYLFYCSLDIDIKHTLTLLCSSP